ncbi:unnamed protein product [Bursaphelenchus xylophilus]|uniref:(pine wood nematode) hypothetical protein n=1 Tax=Bursaphelenchus xylophilus TaxID=6326 RepID=A0A1I7RU87_BURXY|nr:unnamed protein product [Bursaphelenchus xylophilus]CAG9113927.1 unnamed protein product [Bursaphelenchus xylophilus]
MEFALKCLLFCLTTLLANADPNEDLFIKRKAKYVERGLNTIIKPCENFWEYANGNIDYQRLTGEYLRLAKEVLEKPSKKEIPVIKKVRNHFSACQSKGIDRFLNELNNKTRTEKPWEKEVNAFRARLNSSSLENSQTFIELTGDVFRLLYKFTGGEAFSSVAGIVSGRVHKSLAPSTVNLLAHNASLAKDFLNKVFDDDVDISGLNYVGVTMQPLKYRRRRLEFLLALVTNTTLLPRYVSCEAYIRAVFSTYYQKMVHDYYGEKYVKNVAGLFLSDIKELAKTIEAEFKFGNMISDGIRKVMLDLLKNNTFYTLDHPINDDSMFEKHFGNVEFDYPYLNRFRNNFKPMFRAAHGRESGFYRIPRTGYNALHTPTNRNFFDWLLFLFPNYHPEFPEVLRFSGSIFVAAHEIGHGFEDELKGIGAKDPTYSKIYDCLYELYGGHCDPNDSTVCVDPKYNMLENFADYFAVRMAYLAYKRKTLKKTTHRVERRILNKFTNDQLFFVNMAQTMARFGTWKGHGASDTHSPGPLRLWAGLAGMKAFTNAFNCRAGSSYRIEDGCNLYNGKFQPDYNLTVNGIAMK